MSKEPMDRFPSNFNWGTQLSGFMDFYRERSVSRQSWIPIITGNFANFHCFDFNTYEKERFVDRTALNDEINNINGCAKLKETESVISCDPILEIG